MAYKFHTSRTEWDNLCTKADAIKEIANRVNYWLNDCDEQIVCADDSINGILDLHKDDNTFNPANDWDIERHEESIRKMEAQSELLKKILDMLRKER